MDRNYLGFLGIHPKLQQAVHSEESCTSHEFQHCRAVSPTVFPIEIRMHFLYGRTLGKEIVQTVPPVPPRLCGRRNTAVPGFGTIYRYAHLRWSGFGALPFRFFHRCLHRLLQRQQSLGLIATRRTSPDNLCCRRGSIVVSGNPAAQCRDTPSWHGPQWIHPLLA